jgi:hypothetical protein
MRNSNVITFTRANDLATNERKLKAIHDTLQKQQSVVTPDATVDTRIHAEANAELRKFAERYMHERKASYTDATHAFAREYPGTFFIAYSCRPASAREADIRLEE